VIDGWRVEAYEPDRLLRLSAGLKLPGRGWLEFRVDPLDGGRALIRQTATFDPRGVAGRLYWYGVLPLHALVFRGLIRRIAEYAVRDGARPARPLAVSRRAHRCEPIGAARVRPRWTAAVALAAAMTLQNNALPAQTAQPVRTVPSVDLDRYAGEWFEIARFPNRFQKQCVGDVRASYARRSDGRIDVVNRCRTADGETEARGVARIVDERTFAKLKVRFAPAWISFLPAVWGDYWIIGLARDYSWAVVGDPARDYLWILARAAHLDAESTAAAWAAARENRFDVTRLVPTSQTAARRP
jgi:apolipoprotein D and lipocalin family protein